MNGTEKTEGRCYVCFRPINLCFCDQIPRIDNQTDVLIVQHPRERRHAFNSARIVDRALLKSELVCGYPLNIAASDLPFLPGAALLYPGAEVVELDQLERSQLPRQLVVVDGTWHQAKTMVRDVPALRQLPRVRLRPSEPGRFRIRREPTLESLSTLEAVAMAMKVLEPNTPGMGELETAFDAMVNRQLAHPNMRHHWRRNARRSGDGGNVPKRLADPRADIVVAYGESVQVDLSPGTGRTLVYWVAERIRTGETFAHWLGTKEELSPACLAHLQLRSEDFDQASSRGEFCASWSDFFRETDTLAVYNQRTVDLLRGMHADCAPHIILKSIRLGQNANQRIAASLDRALMGLEVKVGEPQVAGRAGKRLANAVALVKFLRESATRQSR